MILCTTVLSVLLFFRATVSALNVPASFENTAIVRTVELGGSAIHVTTSVSTRSLTNNNAKYFFVLAKEQDSLSKWVEAKVKGISASLVVEKQGIDAMLHKSQPFVYYSISLPQVLAVNETTTLLISTIETHATTPLPATAKQADTQSLVYETGAYVLSPYATLSQKTRLRSPSPTIHSHSEPQSLSRYAVDAPVTKSGAIVTYGPYHNIPPSSDRNFFYNVQETVKIHYDYNQPVLTVSSLRRAAEISHWGDNLNIQDDIKLLNDGVRLEGQFSRLDYQQQGFFRPRTGAILPAFILQLPAGARDPYFTDVVGNVSTSRFRPAPPKSKGVAAARRNSVLEVQPRYPLLGGWNYTFRLGWDAPLGGSTVYDAANNKYIATIPFFTHIPGSVVDDAEVKIILPEGATDLQIYVPFAVDEVVHGTHVTYLDTKGRPSITFKKQGLTEKHTESIYVTYSLSLRAHMSKVVAVGSASLILFTLGLVLRRVDTTIHTSS